MNSRQPHAESEILDAVRRTWGFDTLRPMQLEAIRAGLARRDSLVVMPTGGGKSLCYQVPPLLTERCCVVISPLIALMKDQVDGLRVAGYPAAAMHGNMSPEELREVEADALSGAIRLLFVAPERLLTSRMIGVVKSMGVDSFAIDEAHCISQWGHDFRPEYRRLAELRRHLPGASLHAFTATATQRVREDIIGQLGLKDATVLVGTFDRPNLTYRVMPRLKVDRQLAEIVSRHRVGGVIVYCISRKDTESVAAALSAAGIPAKAYHAGLDAKTRKRVQDQFASERLDVVVATVAFGMGIDRSNVRCVVHAAMPKSVEAYQQETGRAGRDGLPAECVMLFSPGDAVKWKQLIARSTEEAMDQSDDEDTLRTLHEAMQVQFGLIAQMERLATSARCRHRQLSEYFGQACGDTPCGACDICLGELRESADSTEIARKVLSCVFRLWQRSGLNFGAGYVTDVLMGKTTDKVQQRGHADLSTFGVLRGVSRAAITSYLGQLADQGFLRRTDGEYPVLELTGTSRDVLRGERAVRLLETVPQEAGKVQKRKGGEHLPLDSDGEAMFQRLRAWRREVADARGVPPYVVFSDATLVEIARNRPRNGDALLNCKGVGARKLDDFGGAILEIVIGAGVRGKVEQGGGRA